VVIGIPAANRSHAEVEPLIGFFVNTLALRLDLSKEPTVGELLRQVKTRTPALELSKIDSDSAELVRLAPPLGDQSRKPLILQANFGGAEGI
jgi:non-ribosomal peptide synthetase component F